MDVDIAVVQFEIVPADPKTNLERASNFVAQAAGKAHVVVFPENFLGRHPTGRHDLVDYGGRYREHFRHLARAHAVDVVTGSFTEGEGRGRFNTTYYIDRTGTILARYRKINLFLYEADQITAGNEFGVAETSYGKVGLAICWDLAFPGIFRRLVRAGAQFVFCPSCWSYEDAGPGLAYDADAEITFVDSVCVARAFENGLCVVFCNAAGERRYPGHAKPIGHSQITVPFKGALCKLGSEEAMVVTRVNTDILDAAESAYRIRRDLACRLVE